MRQHDKNTKLQELEAKAQEDSQGLIAKKTADAKKVESKAKAAEIIALYRQKQLEKDKASSNSSNSSDDSLLSHLGREEPANCTSDYVDQLTNNCSSGWTHSLPSRTASSLARIHYYLRCPLRL